MATKLITRTISENRYNVLCLNMETLQAEKHNFSLGSKSFTSEKKTLEALKEKYDSPALTLVKIIDKYSVDALYAMTEEFFLKNAIAVQDVKAAREYFKSHGEEIEEV